MGRELRQERQLSVLRHEKTYWQPWLYGFLLYRSASFIFVNLFDLPLAPSTHSILHVVWYQERMKGKRIVPQREMVTKPGKHQKTEIYVGRFTTVDNLLFCVHTICMNYVSKTFPLISSSVSGKQLLCFVQGQGQKREKHTTKNFVGFHNHSLLLTMPIWTSFPR